MEAHPGKILEFFNGTKQMMVPLFQRVYEWDTPNWETLWADVLEQYEQGEQEAAGAHFTGAIVTSPAKSIPIGVSKFLVIDGQQRLTTVAILICALRSVFPPDTKEYRKLTRLLLNEDDEGLDHYKLLPTQPDRPAFEALVAEKPTAGSRFARAFEFFRKKLQEPDSEGESLNMERLTSTLQNRLTVVAIHLGESDDPYLIFESLNAKGAPLTQADLIRNYLLLRLHSTAQQKAYEEAWLPMQSLLGEQLTEFMRQYLMLGGEDVAKSAIYAVLKKRLFSVADGAIATELGRMQRLSLLYAGVVGLNAELPPAIQKGLARLRRWEVATANPFLLKLLEAHAQGKVPDVDVARCLQLLESYVVRRTVCRVATNQLKKIFLSLTKEFPTEAVSGWLEKTLASGTSGRRWPKDEEFRDALVSYRAYAQPVDRCKFVLETIEAHYGHKELATFATATIEHVMPQTLSLEWQAALGDKAHEVHDRWLDTFGNLTLTGYNSELSNSPFSKKRELLSDSHFELNKWIAAQGQWTEQEIRARTELLFEQARQVWARPTG
jgi:uncharacterized protein with ParB-like and HNH nuclease domain